MLLKSHLLAINFQRNPLVEGKPGKSLGVDIRKLRPNHKILRFFLSIKFLATLFFKCPMGLYLICET